MATYYVRTDGSDINAGTGPATNQAWQTITKALGVAGIGSGDTLYIAPGVYRGNFVINASAYSAATYIIGDVTASQFSGISAGSVRLSSRSSDTAAYSGNSLTGTSKPFLNISNIYFDGPVSLDQCNNLLIEKCLFYGINEVNGVCSIGNATGATTRNIFRRNIVISPGNTSNATGLNIIERVASQGTNVSDCFFVTNSFGAYISATVSNADARVFNCTFSGYATGAHFRVAGNTPNTAILQNCLFINGSSAGSLISSGTLGNYTENFNRFNMPGSARTNVDAGANSTTTVGWDGVDYGQALLMGYDYIQMYTTLLGSPSINFGTSLNAPTSDIYGVTWTGATPTAGATTYRSLNGIGFYSSTERNASAITIAPGETSRSLYLYLGATGLTHTTTNLTASYTRNGQASVPVTLVAQTPTGSYVSGGFCEVSAPYARGTYRLDVPNAAFDFGADDVTIFVGGANTTNGAVVTCNMQGIAGNIVHIGPFKVIADGLGSDQPLDIVQGVQAPVSVQLVDANENGVDISGATVEAKVYNAIGSLIATYVCVPVYAADGRCTFQLTTLVTNTAGAYNVTLTRTIGGNIVVFGPMKMIVRAN